MSVLSSIVGTVFPPAGIAMRVLGGAKDWAGKAFAWITASAAHILGVALAVALGWGWWGHHEAAKWERQAVHEKAARMSDGRTWQRADQINHTSITLLTSSLDAQSAKVRTWASVAATRQQAAQAALRAQQAHGRALDTVRARIVAEQATGCHTGQSVLDAKEQF